MTGVWSIAPLDLRRRRRSRASSSSARSPRRCSRAGATAILSSHGSFLDAELPGHDPFLLGDMAGAVERIRAAIAARASASASTATTTWTGSARPALAVLYLRELGADVVWHLPSRFEEGYGVSSATLARLADDGVGLVLTVDCGITAVQEIAEAQGARASRSWSPTITGRESASPTARSSRRVRLRIRFPSCAARASCTSSARRCSARSIRRCARNLDLVALATIADVVPLVDENRALASAGLRELACTRRPGLQALMRSARVDPAAVDASAVGFRLAPRINAAGRLGRPDAALELILTDDPDEAKEARGGARGAQSRAPGGGGPDPARGNRARRRAARAGTPAARLRPLARGLARGRHRHRRLPAGGEVQSSRRPRHTLPGRLEGLRAGRSRASTCTARWPPAPRIWSGSGDTARRRACRSRRQRLEAFAEAFAAHADATLADEDLHPVTTGGRRRLGRGAHASARAGARPARAVRAREPRRDAARTRRAALRARDRGRGQAPALPRSPERAGRRERDRLRPGIPARPAARDRASSTSPAG